MLDLQMSTPSWIDTRAAACTSQLVFFDALSGFMQFSTTSAYSRNSWTQTIMFNDWNTIVTLVEEQPGAMRLPWGELEPEELPWGELVPEELPLVRQNDSWQTVYSEYPDLVNADVQVHCDCPAFLWWGSQYNLEQSDTEMFPRGVPYPGIRDPGLSNNICKHLAAVLKQQF